MRKQEEVWQKAHSNPVEWPKLASKERAESVAYFTEFLAGKGVVNGNAVDVGCGQGRNAIFLAEKGFEVYAFDYAPNAIEETAKRAAEKKVNLHLSLNAIDGPWPFPSDFFDIAVDSFSSIDVETIEGRQNYLSELQRTLRPGGYALVAVVSADDEFEKEMMEKSPGKEKNSVYWPGSGKFQKDYDEKELKDFYKEFEIIELKKVKKPAVKLGRNYTATNYWMILRKPV